MVKLSDPDSAAVSGRRGFGWPRKRLALLLAMVALVFVILKAHSWLYPPPEIPTPADLDQLQPQLRAYLSKLVETTHAAPRDARSHATLGIAYAANQLWQEARGCFENAARLNPNEPLAHLYVGVATEELGNYPEALRLYRELSSRFPEFPQVYFRIGRLSLQLAALDEAQKAFARLTELAPGEWRGHAGLGEVALRRGDYAAAAVHLEKAVALDPQSGNAHSLLGLAYRGLGRHEDAQFELARGVDSQTYPMPDAWGDTAHEHMRLVQDQLEMANRHLTEGATDRAITLLATAATYNPTNLALLNALSIALHRAERPAEAQIVLNQLFTQNDSYLPALITASLVAQALDQPRESLAFAQRAVQLSPDNAHAHVALANVLLSAERDAEALEALRIASTLDPKNADLHLQIGDVLLLNLNEPGPALEHYRTACNLDPTLVSAQIRLTRMLIEQGDAIEARRALTVIRKLDPDNPALPILEQQLPDTTRAETN
jgi:tetratricopeptide (TPR) repeat protein